MYIYKYLHIKICIGIFKEVFKHYECIVVLFDVKQNPVIPKPYKGASNKSNIYACVCNKLYYSLYISVVIIYSHCITGLIWAENRSDMDCE